MLQLRITIPALDKTVAMRFNVHCSVRDVCKEIREKAYEGGADHGLYRVATPGKNHGTWLKMEKTLSFYDIESREELVYKKKHRPVKIHFADGSVRSVMVDESLSVMEITSRICVHTDIVHTDAEYSLCAEGVWLNPTLTLAENGVESTTVLSLRKRWFYSDGELDLGRPFEVHMLFAECRSNVLNGTHLVTLDDAVMLAALDCQSQYGDFQPSLHTPSWVQLNELVAERVKQVKPVAILNEYRKLLGMKSLNAKFRYVQVCRASSSFGMAFYEVKERPARTKKEKSVLVGISRDRICICNVEDFSVIRSWPLIHLRRWAASPKSFTMDFGDYCDEYVTFMTTRGEEMSQQISGYIDIILKRRTDRGRVEEEDESYVASEESIAPIRRDTSTTFTSSVGQATAHSEFAREFQLPDGQHQISVSGQPNPAPVLRGKGIVGQQAIGIVPPANGEFSEILKCLLSEEDFASGCAKVLPADITPEECLEQIRVRSDAIVWSPYFDHLSQNPSKARLGLLEVNSKQFGIDLVHLLAAARRVALLDPNDENISLLSSAKAVSEAFTLMLKCSQACPEEEKNVFIASRSALRAAKAYLVSNLGEKRFNAQLTFSSEADEIILSSAKCVSSAIRELISAAPKEANEKKLSAVEALLPLLVSLAAGLSNKDARKEYSTLLNALEIELSSVIQSLPFEKREKFCVSVLQALSELNSAVTTAHETIPSVREMISEISQRIASISKNNPGLASSASIQQIDSCAAYLTRTSRAIASDATALRLGPNMKLAATELNDLMAAVTSVLKGSFFASMLQCVDRITFDADKLVDALQHFPNHAEIVRFAKNIAANAYDAFHEIDIRSKNNAAGFASRDLLLANARLALVAAQLGRASKLYAKDAGSAESVSLALQQLRLAQQSVQAAAEPSAMLLDASARVRSASSGVCESVTNMINAALVSAGTGSSDAATRARLTAASSRVCDATAALQYAARSLLAGVQRCDHAVESVTVAVTRLEAHLTQPVAVSSDTAALRSQCEEVLKTTEELSTALSRVLSATSNTPELWGSAATQIASAISSLPEKVILAASSSATSARATELLRVAKKVTSDVLETAVAIRSTAAATNICPSASADLKEATSSAYRSLSRLSGMVQSCLVDLDLSALAENDDLRAERELQQAAASIERAAISLRKKQESETVSAVDFAVLDTACAVTSSIGALLRAAVAAQKHRVEARGQHADNSHPLYRNDPMWANGLISAAQTVAATAAHLVQITNTQKADEPMLLACVSAVNAVTVQLVSASRAKCEDPHSDTQRALELAAKSVSKSTAELSNAAKLIGIRDSSPTTTSAVHKEPPPPMSSAALHKQKIEELEYNAKILRMERELADARAHLLAIRKDQYSTEAKNQ